MRGPLRYLLTSLLVGMLSVGLAWAGSGLIPVRTDKTDIKLPKLEANKDQELGDETPIVDDDSWASFDGANVLAGASKINLYPRPEDYQQEFPGAVWNKNFDECQTFAMFDFPAANPTDHLATTGSPWPENPDCIYQGGFDIGPVNPVTEFDTEYGIWVRSFAVKGSNGKTLTLTILDGEGYFWDYKTKCDDCGIKQLTADLASDASLGLDKEGIIIAATHSHAAPEFIGGWGFVPDWYMKQVSDSIKLSIKEAVTNMRPAELEIGEELARPFNNERRDTYRAAEEQQLTWLRAVGRDAQGNAKTIGTIGAYAAHPTSFGKNDTIAHPDWPGLFEKRLEQRFGGVGLHFMTGLGNMSSAGRHIGVGLADLIPEVGGGVRLNQTEVKYAQTTWAQPATNVPLNALGLPGFFDREFLSTPAQVSVDEDNNAEDEESNRQQCVSASPVSVELPATAVRIGNQFVLTAAPGEIFANFSNSVKERSGALVTMPIGQANDALGYMPQSFELNPVGQQGLGFTPATGYVGINYEDSYSIDRCVGDMVLEQTLKLLRGI